LTPLTNQNAKIGTSSWRSIENCIGPNSGTVSRVHLNLARVLTTQVASRDVTQSLKVKRQHHTVT